MLRGTRAVLNDHASQVQSCWVELGSTPVRVEVKTLAEVGIPIYCLDDFRVAGASTSSHEHLIIVCCVHVIFVNYLNYLLISN